MRTTINITIRIICRSSSRFLATFMSPGQSFSSPQATSANEGTTLVAMKCSKPWQIRWNDTNTSKMRNWSFYSKNESKLDVQSKLIFIHLSVHIIHIHSLWWCTSKSQRSQLKVCWMSLRSNSTSTISWQTQSFNLALIHRRMVVLDESYSSLESCMYHLMKLQQQRNRQSF